MAEGDDADHDGRLDPGEVTSEDAYTYDSFRGLASTTQDLSVLDHDVRFDYVYSRFGLLASVAASLDGGTTDDYVNDYLYDNVGRVARIAQSGVSGGNAVAEKRVDYFYDDLGQRDSVVRWADPGGSPVLVKGACNRPPNRLTTAGP